MNEKIEELQKVIAKKDEALSEVLNFLSHIEPRVGEQAFAQIWGVVYEAYDAKPWHEKP